MIRTANYVLFALAAIILSASTTLNGTPAFADDASHCAELMKFGIYDKYRTFTTEYQYLQIKSFFKNYQFSTRQAAEAKAGELGLNIIDILSLNINGKSSSSNFEQWQQEIVKSTYEEAVHAGLKEQTVEKISTAMTHLIETCLTKKGLHAFIIPAADKQTFSFTIDFMPLSDTTPTAKGSFSIKPSSVAATCSPKSLLNENVKIGPQGVSVSLRRLPTETVTITYNTDQGSGTIVYEAYVIPKPSISFKAQNESIQSGQSTKLVWDVQNARSVEFEGRGEVNDSGNVEVTPTSDTEYRLKVTSLDGKTTSTFVKVTVAPPPPVLTAARVHFHTTDDNKDHDTHVTVNVSFGASTVASVGNTWGEFKDNTDSGWKDLTIHEKPRKDALIGGGRVQLIEAPKGHDEWHFNWTLVLTFSDGTTKQYDWNEPKGVDFDRTTLTKQL